jgi:hypothetical protein
MARCFGHLKTLVITLKFIYAWNHLTPLRFFLIGRFEFLYIKVPVIPSSVLQERPSLANRVKKLLSETTLAKADGPESYCQGVCFVWPYEAEEVSLSSNHDNWNSWIRLTKTEEIPNFHCIVKVPVHKTIHFRFLVDGSFRCDPAHKVVRGKDGGFVNVMIVRPNHLESFFEETCVKETQWSQMVPSIDEFKSYYQRFQMPEAPRHCLAQPEDRSFSSALLNHVYKCNIKYDGVICLSINQRIKQKRVLTVYYKPSPQENSPRQVSEPTVPLRCPSFV